MRLFYKTCILTLSYFAFSSLAAQPVQFNFPCDEFSFPLGATSSELFTIVTFNGGNFPDDSWVAAIDEAGLIIGQGQIDNAIGCAGEQSLLSIVVYEDLGNNACAPTWGADRGETITLVVEAFGSFYQVPGAFVYPDPGAGNPTPPSFVIEGGDFCTVVNSTPADEYAPFPVTLESFQGQAANNGKAVQLNWVSAQEEEVSHFDVERSFDGQQWEQVGQVAAAGNSTERQFYSFNDVGELNATNYYRLNMVDNDGSAMHSGIVIVNIENTGDRQVSLFPNPANGTQVSIQLQGQWDENAPIAATLIDAQGRQLQTYQGLRTGTTAVALPSGTPVGLYLLRTTQGNTTINHKLMIR